VTAVFDFDGTLVPERNNLYWHLIRLLPHPGWRSIKSAAFVQAMSGLIPAATGKVVDFNRMYKLLLAATFSGLPVDLVARAGDRLADRIDDAVYSEMGRELDRHAEQPRYLVSCNTEPIVSHWCDRNGITCVATRLHVAGGRYTGLVDGELNRGHEKVHRLEELGVDMADVSAYGNSLDDEQLLRASDQPILVDPDRGLDQRWPFVQAQRITIGGRS
jgi:phosphoserine phosphatase